MDNPHVAQVGALNVTATHSCVSPAPDSKATAKHPVENSYSVGSASGSVVASIKPTIPSCAIVIISTVLRRILTLLIAASTAEMAGALVA